MVSFVILSYIFKIFHILCKSLSIFMQDYLREVGIPVSLTAILKFGNPVAWTKRRLIFKFLKIILFGHAGI